MTEITLQDLLSQETKRNPNAFYAPLRSSEPLIYVKELNSWLLTTYEDALWLFKDPRFIKDMRKVAQMQGQIQPNYEEMNSQMRTLLMVDPPDHTRLRSLVSKAFTPRMIEQMRPRVQQIADELVDTMQGEQEVDFIPAFAYPLPITVISELLGIPAEDRLQFRVWTQGILSMEDERRAEALQEFFAYIKALLAMKQTRPANDLTSELVRVEEHGDQLSENELISMIFLLIVAGHETTVNLLGNGLLALLEHPDQLQRLREDPSLLAGAVEELLRYTTPVSLSDERWASEDVPLHGKVIRKGDMVLAALISANSDPLHFSSHETLDITRHENAHLAFGKGIHFCLGAPLARLEGQIAFGTLLRRLPNLRLAEDSARLVWSINPMLRGVKSLPVKL